MPRRFALWVLGALACDPVDVDDPSSEPLPDSAYACGSRDDEPRQPEAEGGGSPLFPDTPCPTDEPFVESRVFGSGATWRIGSDGHGSPWLADGDVRLRVRARAFASECPSPPCPGLDDVCIPLVVTSVPEQTAAGEFALAPNYAIAIDDPFATLDATAIDIEVDIDVPDDVLGECVAQVGFDGAPSVQLERVPVDPPFWLSAWASAVRPCDTQAICAGACTDLEIDPIHCGACGNVCDGTCIAGECTPALLALPAGTDLVSDGAAVYWIVLDDAGAPNRVRRAAIVEGELVLDELDTEGSVHAWGAAPGRFAWIETHPELGFRLHDWSGAEPIALLSFPDAGPKLQPLATAAVWAGVVDPGLQLFARTSTEEVLVSGCLGGTVGWVYDFASRGDELFVLTDDGDADGSNDLWRCSVADMAGEERLDDLDLGEGAATIEVAGDTLYIGRFDQVRRVDASLQYSSLVTTTVDAAIATDESHVYARTTDGVVRIGNDEDRDVVMPPHPVGDFAVAGGHLFADSGTGSLVAFPLAPG
jgi:hypothetical protein